MWTDNTRNTKIRGGGQIEVFQILNGYENIYPYICFEIKESKINRGHNFTLVKKPSRLDVRKFSFSQISPFFIFSSMLGINYQQSVHMLVVSICSRIE